MDPDLDPLFIVACLTRLTERIKPFFFFLSILTSIGTSEVPKQFTMNFYGDHHTLVSMI